MAAIVPERRRHRRNRHPDPAAGPLRGPARRRARSRRRGRSITPADVATGVARGVDRRPPCNRELSRSPCADRCSRARTSAEDLRLDGRPVVHDLRVARTQHEVAERDERRDRARDRPRSRRAGHATPVRRARGPAGRRPGGRRAAAVDRRPASGARRRSARSRSRASVSMPDSLAGPSRRAMRRPRGVAAQIASHLARGASAVGSSAESTATTALPRVAQLISCVDRGREIVDHARRSRRSRASARRRRRAVRRCAGRRGRAAVDRASSTTPWSRRAETHVSAPAGATAATTPASASVVAYHPRRRRRDRDPDLHGDRRIATLARASSRASVATTVASSPSQDRHRRRVHGSGASACARVPQRDRERSARRDAARSTSDAASGLPHADTLNPVRVDIVTIFPEFFSVLDVSLLGRARETGVLDIARARPARLHARPAPHRRRHPGRRRRRHGDEARAVGRGSGCRARRHGRRTPRDGRLPHPRRRALHAEPRPRAQRRASTSCSAAAATRASTSA